MGQDDNQAPVPPDNAIARPEKPAPNPDQLLGDLKATCAAGALHLRHIIHQMNVKITRGDKMSYRDLTRAFDITTKALQPLGSMIAEMEGGDRAGKKSLLDELAKSEAVTQVLAAEVQRRVAEDEEKKPIDVTPARAENGRAVDPEQAPARGTSAPAVRPGEGPGVEEDDDGWGSDVD